MFKGKTKRGVEINRLLGVPEKKRDKAWALVIDRSQMRIFEMQKEGTKNLAVPVTEIPWKNGRLKPREILADRPGRSFDSFTKARKGQTGGARHGMSSAQDPKDHELELFLRKGCEYLEKAQNEDRFDELVVYSEAQVLGALKKVFSKPLLKKIKKLNKKDLSWLSNRQLEQRLELAG